MGHATKDKVSFGFTWEREKFTMLLNAKYGIINNSESNNNVDLITTLFQYILPEYLKKLLCDLSKKL